MRVLVTGGSGLLGNELILQLLAAGKTIRATYNKNQPNLIHPSLEWVHGNLLDVVSLAEVITGVDEIYNCAGLVSFRQKDAELLYKINVEGTANLVNAAIGTGVRKLVHVSSVATLGTASDRPVTEDVEWGAEKITSNYGQSKYQGELEVWRGIAEGLQAVIVNPSIILGNGNWNEGSTSLFKSAYDEMQWYTDGVKGFVDVKDVARAMMMLMDSEEVSGRYIINASNISFRELFNMMATCFNKRPPSRKATPFLAGLLWRFQWLRASLGGRPPLITAETASTAFSKVEYDNSRLLKLFPGFTYTHLEDSLRNICASLQQKLNNH